VARTHDLPIVFDFLDYREFLSAWWTALRKTGTRYSYRWFSRKAGLGSPSYLKLVMDGDRNLTEDTAGRFASALDLDPIATRYWQALVKMNQAQTTEERARWYEVLSSVPPYRAARRIDRSQYDYYALWYCVPIRELVAREDFVEDPEWIARQLRPPIRPAQAKEALDLLSELGLLERIDGRLHQAEALLTTGPELRVLAARRFHQQMLRRAEEAMDSMPLKEREVGGVTLRLTKPQVEHLRKRMYEIRQEILQLDGTGEGDQAVHHFAFQLFPVTDWPDGDRA
jgi:uncharacterized protein (TIGR02147 family)